VRPGDCRPDSRSDDLELFAGRSGVCAGGGPVAGWSPVRFAAWVNLGVEIGVNPDSHPWADAPDGCCAAL